MRSFEPKRWLWLAALLGLLWAGPSNAAELAELKAAGVVGERADGYLGLVDSAAPPQARELVTQVNAKRQAEYQRIAVQHNIAMAEVEALAGKKTLAKTEPGAWIYVESWRQK